MTNGRSIEEIIDKKGAEQAERKTDRDEIREKLKKLVDEQLVELPISLVQILEAIWDKPLDQDATLESIRQQQFETLTFWFEGIEKYDDSGFKDWVFSSVLSIGQSSFNPYSREVSFKERTLDTTALYMLFNDQALDQLFSDFQSDRDYETTAETFAYRYVSALEDVSGIGSTYRGRSNLTTHAITPSPHELIIEGRCLIRIDHSIHKLPDGLSMRGIDLSINNPLFAELPDGLVVEDLDIRGTQIKEIPKDIKIYNDLHIYDHPNIESLPEGLALGKLGLHRTSVKKLPKGLIIRDNSLSISTDLGAELELSEDTLLGASIYSGSSYLSNLPENLSILHLEVKPKDTEEKEFRLPENLTVRGNLSIPGINISELPKGLKVRGRLNISGTQIADLPADIEVGEGINITNTMVKTLPEGLKIKGGITVLAGDLDLTSLPGETVLQIRV